MASATVVATGADCQLVQHRRTEGRLSGSQDLDTRKEDVCPAPSPGQTSSFRGPRGVRARQAAALSALLRGLQPGFGMEAMRRWVYAS
jgi:hypothetical protein